MKKILDFLSGRKTYIVAAVIAIFTFAQAVGWITQSEFETAVAFFGALGLYTVRSAISKLE